MYNCKHIKKERWWHSLFGKPSLTVATCKAKNKVLAEKKFRLMGCHFGMFH
jgi:hypothetical protein